MKSESRQTGTKRQAHRIKIGKVAAKLFNERGYLETSMDDISSASRLSKGGIYHYFSSKHEILYFVLSNYMDRILEGLKEELGAKEGSFPKIRLLISRHIKLYIENVSESKTLIHSAHSLPAKYLKVIEDKEREYYRIVVQILSEYFAGRIPKGKLTALTFSLFGMCNWIYSWYDPRGSVTPEELSETIYRIFSKGMINFK